MADRKGFEHRLYGSPHLIRWRQEDINLIAARFGISAEDIPTEQAVWNRQKDRAKTTAAFVLDFVPATGVD
jgi:hypothetical protein